MKASFVNNLIVLVALSATVGCNGYETLPPPALLDQMGEISISSLVVKDDEGNYIRFIGEKRNPDGVNDPSRNSVTSYFEAGSLRLYGHLTIQKYDDWILITRRHNGQLAEEFIKESHLVGFIVDNSESLPPDFGNEPDRPE